MVKGYIYIIINKINHKKYVGQTTLTIEERFKAHVSQANNGEMSPLHCAMRKYGVENFKIVAWEETALLDEREMYWIETLNTYEGIGYNATKGGQGRKGGETFPELEIDDQYRIKEMLGSYILKTKNLEKEIKGANKKLVIANDKIAKLKVEKAESEKKFNALYAAYQRLKDEKDDLEIRIRRFGAYVANRFGFKIST